MLNRAIEMYLVKPRLWETRKQNRLISSTSKLKGGEKKQRGEGGIYSLKETR